MTNSVEGANEVSIKAISSTGSRSKYNQTEPDIREKHGCTLRDIIQNIKLKGGKPSVDRFSLEMNRLSTTDRVSAFKALQSTRGNRYVQKVVAQAKLDINMPGDINEQEADSIADRIMRMPEPANQSATEVRQMTHVPDNRIMLPDFHLKSHGSGQPLPKQERAFFESRFDHDFSQVQIHADATATESAEAIGAKAYTIGQNIAFGPGHYNPGTSLGRRLIAHELTHVIQQQGSGNDGSLIQRDDDDPYHGSPDPDQRPSPPLTHNPQKNFDPDNPYDIDHSGGLKWDKGELVPAPCIDDSCYDDSWPKKFEPQPNEKSDAEKECPEDKWNRVWQICCPGKQYYNEDTKNCEEPSTPPIRTPNYCIPPTQWNPIKQSCCPGNLPSFNPISGECEPAYSPNPAGIPRNEGYHECPLSQWDLINHQCCPIDAPHFNFETFKCEPWIKLSLNVPTPQPPNLQPPKPYEP